MILEAERIIHKARQPLSLPSEGITFWKASLNQRGFSHATIYAYGRAVIRLLAYDSEPDIFTIEAYLSSLRDQGMQVNSLIHHIKSIKSFFNYLKKHRLWPSNPARHIPYPKRQYKESIVPSVKAIQSLFSQKMSEKDRLIITLFLDTGVRLSELASLSLDRINLADRELYITGKGCKDRLIPFSESVADLLVSYIPQVAKSQDGKSPQWLFPARHSNSKKGYLSVSSFQERLAALCNSAGIDHYTPHQLRHFFATYQIKDGADIKAVSKELGHASVATTMDIYHHVDWQTIKDTHDEHSPLNVLNKQ